MSFLEHYGVKRRSGRYPWGSGEDPYQGAKSFQAQVKELRKQGLSEKDIASSFINAKGNPMSTGEFRALVTQAKEAQYAGDCAQAYRLKEKGFSEDAIAERLGVSKSTVRNMLNPSEKTKKDSTRVLSDGLEEAIANSEAGFIDVGTSTELGIGVSRTKFMSSIYLLQNEGYNVYYVPVQQQGTGKTTSMMVLAKPDLGFPDVMANKDKVGSINGRIEDVGDDGVEKFYPIEKPQSIDASRVYVRYAEDGGVDMDGTIQLRRGVEDLSLGNATYAQCRIAVNDSHYLKGMAMYSDDIPDGYDIVFNTNKHKGTPMMDSDPDAKQVLKPLKDDPENPFGASIKMDDELILAQRHYVDKDGNTKLSAINIVNEEGNWSNWSKSVASQMLSKQAPALAKRQLDWAKDLKQEEFDEIMSLTNPTVKKKLLESYADECDAAAVNLKAAAFPRQSTNVILPITDLKDNEIYAPNYKNGEQVALIRYPHGGTFEIPVLTVNNKSKLGQQTIGKGIDAVGIKKAAADKLSGADFDGDTVLVIPIAQSKIKSTPSLKGLQDFDPKEAYPAYDGMVKMTKKQRGMEMGKVTNLITDMTVRGATYDEIERAVRHSMVVIDAYKHNLNYKQSYIDNGIAELKKKYQGSENAGASTLLSRSTAQAHPAERKEGVLVTDPKTGKTRRQYIDPDTGKKLYTETGATIKDYVRDESGQVVQVVDTGKKKTQKSTQGYEAEDARSLSSGTRIEEVYANYANSMKALGNKARKATLSTEPIKYDPSAKKTYAKEVASLDAKLNTALKNAPLERKAQAVAEVKMKAIKSANPDMDNDDIKKERGRQLKIARNRVGAGKERVNITDKEWEAIQAGAITNNKLSRILDNTDLDRVKQLATPRSTTGMSSTKLARARAMASNGYTQAEIAEQLGVSVSTINKEL